MKNVLKEAFFFWYWISDFGPKSLGNDLGIVRSREIVRLKAYNLYLILRTYFMIIRPLKNFLRALEVGCVRFWEAQKVLKIMEFGSLRECVEKASL